MKRLIKLAIIGVAAIAIAACSSDDDDGGTTGGTTAGTTTGGDPAFTGGLFQLTTHAVDDTCLDGALDLLFMPNGADAPYDLLAKTELPASDALPASYPIELQAPFSKMDVTVVADGENMKIVDAAQAAVKVDEAAYGDCESDMTISANITVVDDDTVDVNATVTIGSFTSAADSQCPQATTPCTVTLTMKGAR
jgi:hypothetical protein